MLEFGGEKETNDSRYTVEPVIMEGGVKSEIQDAKLKRKHCSSLGVSPLSGGEESGPHSREFLVVQVFGSLTMMLLLT